MAERSETYKSAKELKEIIHDLAKTKLPQDTLLERIKIRRGELNVPFGTLIGKLFITYWEQTKETKPCVLARYYPQDGSLPPGHFRYFYLPDSRSFSRIYGPSEDEIKRGTVNPTARILSEQSDCHNELLILHGALLHGQLVPRHVPKEGEISKAGEASSNGNKAFESDSEKLSTLVSAKP